MFGKATSFILILCNVGLFCVHRPSIIPGENAFDKLKGLGLVRKEKPFCLHLGCGQSHFNGYVNIDFPPSKHTAQTTVGADVFADIVSLNFPDNSVDEIRSHHVFEHFDRQTALALLCKWHKWLKIGGKLVIETPDFEASVKLFVGSQLSYSKKQAVLRHIFGSHEAGWALHYDGWYEEKFFYVLSNLGFCDITFRKTKYLEIIKNIIVTSYKRKNLDFLSLSKKAKEILRDSLVSSKEKMMFNIWCDSFDKVFKNFF